MALNLKRKRGQASTVREAPPLDSDEVSGLSDGSSNGSDEDSQAEDNGEWGGIDGESSMQVDSESHGKRKRPPTGEELRQMKDASELFQSSAFKLQIDALVPNVQPKPSQVAAIERFLLKLHPLLTNIRPVSPQHPLHASRSLLKKGVSVPYSDPLPTEDTKWKVAYQPPTDITLVGSWANKVSVKGKDGKKFGIDLAVEMPDELFQDKDYLNGRFFHKRAFYLATIAAAITQPKSGLDVDAAYQSLSDDPRLTKLVLTCDRETDNGLKKLNAQICIIPVISLTCPISMRHLSPTHTSVKTSEEDNLSPKPTPVYNAALLTHKLAKQQLLAAHNLKNSVPAFGEALCLLRIWANQRGFGEGTRMCVRGFEGKGPFWASVLEVVINGEDTTWMGGAKSGKSRKALGRGLSSYQLFRAALDFLSKRDWATESVFMLSASQENRYPVEGYRHAFRRNPVFVNGSVPNVNILSDVPLGSMKLLSLEANTTLELLNRTSAPGGNDNDMFWECFLKDHRDIFTRFDSVLRIDLAKAATPFDNVQFSIDTGSSANGFVSSVASILEAGLGDRVKGIALLQPSSDIRPLSQALPASHHIIYVGLVYNEHNAFRQVDHGPVAPSSEDEEVSEDTKAFRELWGSKAELRRFKDGRILESVVWDVRTVDEKATIPVTIARYLLRLHFGISAEDKETSTLQGAFDSYLRLPEQVSRPFSQLKQPASIGFKGAHTAFEQLSKQIRALEDKLPLSLLQISPCSPELRYTSALAPMPLPSALKEVIPSNAQYTEPLQLILQFEKSAKWPDELQAIQKIKLAFIERIARDLMQSVPGLEARVVVANRNPRPAVEDQARLEIITPEGWAYHIRIWHDREATLLDRILEESSGKGKKKRKTDTKIKGKDREDALQAKATYVRNFLHAPLHHRAIASLNHRFGAYAGTVRLVKRWLASHWLMGEHDVSPEAVELLCAKFFLYPGWDTEEKEDEDVRQTDKKAPATKERGFSLVVEFLSRWDWREGFHVPLFGHREDQKELQLPKGTHVSGVWRLKTDADEDGSLWTANGPDAIVAHRITAIAKATWACLIEVENGKNWTKRMFTHPDTDYDFIIHLKPDVLTRYGHNVAYDSHKLTQQEGSPRNRPGFDPARAFFEDLERIYSDTFKIFHDPLGGDKFGGIWDPSLESSKPFRVLGGYSALPIAKGADHKASKEDLVGLNEDAILSELERMGHGLVAKITARS